jgi:hypothetical protein
MDPPQSGGRRRNLDDVVALAAARGGQRLSRRTWELPLSSIWNALQGIAGVRRKPLSRRVHYRFDHLPMRFMLRLRSGSNRSKKFCIDSEEALLQLIANNHRAAIAIDCNSNHRVMRIPRFCHLAYLPVIDESQDRSLSPQPGNGVQDISKLAET